MEKITMNYLNTKRNAALKTMYMLLCERSKDTTIW